MNSNAAHKAGVPFINVIFLAFLAISVVLANAATGQPVYVNGDSIAPLPDGRSWESAYPDLQSAVDTAVATGGGEIWVAQGSYTSSTDPVLTLKEGVALYGGFAGTESSLDQRDWQKYPTIIDGEGTGRCAIGANNTVLNGFILKNGSASVGGGM